MSGRTIPLDEKVRMVAKAYETLDDALDRFDPDSLVARCKAGKIRRRLGYLDLLTQKYAEDYGEGTPFDNIRERVSRKAEAAGIYEERPGFFGMLRKKFDDAYFLKASLTLVAPFSGLYYAWDHVRNRGFVSKGRLRAYSVGIGLELIKLIILASIVHYCATGGSADGIEEDSRPASIEQLYGPE